MLDSGEFTSIAELAEREGTAPSFMTRVMRLTLLAPELVEAFPGRKAGAGRNALLGCWNRFRCSGIGNSGLAAMSQAIAR